MLARQVSAISAAAYEAHAASLEGKHTDGTKSAPSNGDAAKSSAPPNTDVIPGSLPTIVTTTTTANPRFHLQVSSE
jgi:hypothetical protein